MFFCLPLTPPCVPQYWFGLECLVENSTAVKVTSKHLQDKKIRDQVTCLRPFCPACVLWCASTDMTCTADPPGVCHPEADTFKMVALRVRLQCHCLPMP